MKTNCGLFAIALAMSGCAVVRVESLSPLKGQAEAMAFHGRDEQRQKGATISVAGLSEILARATWVSSRPAHKGGSWLRFADNREVFLPVGFSHFYVANVPGHFEVRSEDIARYREVSERIHREANQALASIAVTDTASAER